MDNKLNHETSWIFFGIFAGLFWLGALVLMLLDSTTDVVTGLGAILVSEPVVVSDFLAVGGGAAGLCNGAVIASFNVWLIKHNRLSLEGTLVAAFFTVLGFSFIGKTFINILPIYLGGWLYWMIHRVALKELLPVVLFATSLAPVSTWLFGHPQLPLAVGAFLALAVGVALGYLIFPTTRHLRFFHQGHSLYHVGFCSGLLASCVAAAGSVLNLEIALAQTGAGFVDGRLGFLVVVVILIVACTGFWLNPSGKNCPETQMMGNMAWLGGLGLAYVCLVGGTFSGPVLAGLLTLIGFGACGKNVANCWPVMAGALGGVLFLHLPLDQPEMLGAVLFATTLAPIVTSYGKMAGLVAGFCHLILVGQTGALHGGLCLYNNGFSGGLVAGTLVSLLEGLRYKKSSF